MPRRPRIDLPGIPQHVVQRGNDRRRCFFDHADYARYLDALRELAPPAGCTVHAYVLMANHVHLLVTPLEPAGVSRLMQALGRHYVRYVNDRHQRTGTLWEGRFKACLVDSERYVLACYRYIELNPVRAGVVGSPNEYAWSSYRSNAMAVPDGLTRPHAVYDALGRDTCARTRAYRSFVMDRGDDSELDEIRSYTQRQHALGTAAFQAELESRLGRPVTPGRMGRPRRPEAH
jgi:putative transposase